MTLIEVFPDEKPYTTPSRMDEDSIGPDILDSLPGQIALINGSGRILHVNLAWSRLAEGEVGDGYLELCSPEVAAGARQVLEGASAHFFTDTGDLRVTVTPARAGAVVMLQPNPVRLYAMASAINEAILRKSEPLALYQAACRIVVEGGMLMAWVGFVPEGKSEPEVVARWGKGSDYLDHIRVSIQPGGLGDGPAGRAFRSGQGSVCNDIAGDQSFAPWREAALSRGYRSGAAFALKSEGKSVGLLAVYGDQPGLFDPEVMRLLASLADNLSFARAVQVSEQQKSALAQEMEREHARLLEAQSVAQRASETLADLVQIQQELTVNRWTLTEAMEFICVRAQTLTGGAGATVELLEGDELVCDICSGIARPNFGLRLPLAESLSGLSVRSDEPLYAADTELDERVCRQASRQFGVRSLICAPLRIRGQAIGVLKVLSDRPHAFAPRDLHHLRILTETLGNILERQQSADALRASVNDLRNLAESMPQIVWTTDPAGKCTYLNRLWVEYTGFSQEESYGDGWMSCFHPEDMLASRLAWEQATGSQGNYSMKSRLRRADGEFRWWLIRGEPMRNEHGEVTGWLGSSTDIHDLTVANRALQMLRHCDEALVRAESEPQLLQSICENAVQLGGYRMAWVGYALDDEAKTIAPQVHAGHEMGYLSEVHISWDSDRPNGRGPGGRVIREGQPTQIVDLSQEPRFSPWSEAARVRGYKSLVNLPLRDEQRTFGSFSLFRGEVASVSADELRLLQELADELAFGIMTLRARAERQRLQDAVLAMARGVSATLGDDFFGELTRHLVDAMQADAGFIALLPAPDSLTARTIAIILNGQPAANFEYLITGTPCEVALQRPFAVCERGTQDLFPQAQKLAELGMEAYAGSCLRNARGQCVGMMVVLFAKPIRSSDFLISTLQIFAARAASELERQQSDARVREQASLLDKAQDAILVCDLQERVTYWNQGAERLYGWTAQEAQGQRLDDLLQSDARSVAVARVAVLESGEWQGELQHLSRLGERLTISCRWTLVRDVDGAPQSILSIGTDITERKRLEEQFLRAQRLESIGTLAGGIAHDLNNALSPILMSVELLRLQFPGAENQELVDSIASSAERGADMVRQLLSFARGLHGERVSVPIAGLLSEVAKIGNDTFLKSIRVRASCPPDLWGVEGDPTQIQQVLMNLCVNARDAMPAGGDLVLSAQNRHLEAGAFVLLQVKDNGVGIPADILEKIFDPFFTTKDIGQGTGLGLSTSMAIVKSHGGFVQVQSQPGQGATFQVYLPARPEQKASPRNSLAAESPGGQGELVLVVDDEEPIRKVTRRTLEAFGYRVLLASDGFEALKLYDLHRADIRVVLTDMMMPGQDGPALIKELRSLNAHLPIIGASGLSDQAEVELEYLLPKPYQTETLLKALRDLLDRR